MFKSFLFRNKLVLELNFGIGLDYLIEEFEMVLEMNNNNLEKSLDDIKEYYLDMYQIKLV